MLVPCFAACLLQQQPVYDTVAYVEAHRSADAALVAGELANASANFRRCLDLSPTNPTVAYGLACVAARSGSQREALYWLETAEAWGYADADLVLWDPDLACVHDDLRFGAAIARMREAGSGRGDTGVLRRIRDMANQTYALDVAVDDAGTQVAVTHGETVRFLNARDGRQTSSPVPLGNSVWAVAFAPGGQRLAALTWDGRVHVLDPMQHTPADSWDALGPPPKKELGWAFGAVLQFDPSGTRLLVGGQARPLGLWTTDGHLIATWSSPGDFFAVPVAWSASGKLLAIPHESTIAFFDGSTGAATNQELTTPARVFSVAFSPDERWLATGHSDNRVRLWDLTTRELVFDHHFDDIFDAEMNINAVAFSPDGAMLAASTGEYSYLDVLRVPSGDVVRHYEWGGGHFGEPYELRWNLDGTRLWYPFVCGGMPCDEMVFDGRAAGLKYRGRSPRISRTGIGIATTLGGVLALDTAGGRCLWYRPNLGRDGDIVQAPTGYFAASVERLHDIVFDVDPAPATPAPAVLDLAADLFDPKRLRASCAGVPLLVPRL